MNWTKALNEAAREPAFPNYGTFTETRVVKIDCSLGENPVLSDISQFSKYTNTSEILSGCVTSRWGNIKKEHISWGAGSQGVLSCLGEIFDSHKLRILGYMPQYVPGLIELGATRSTYRSIRLAPPEFKLDVRALAEAIDDDTTFVYLDNPNNPTGGTVPLDDVAWLARQCRERGVLLVVDECYADFLPDTESALTLPDENIICIRSFSKGLGMAALRIGYIVIRDERLLEFYKNTELLFSISVPSAKIAARYLPQINIDAMRGRVRALKARVLEFIAGYKMFSVAATHPNTPIILLTWHEERDLYEKLMEAGIRTETGTAFCVGENSVRLRVPLENQFEMFKSEWEKLFR